MKQDNIEPTNVIKVITSSGSTRQETRGACPPVKESTLEVGWWASSSI